MDYSLAHFSERLREARIAKNLSQRDLSKLAGVPQSHISKIESSQVDLRLSSLVALANALDLEVELIPRSAMPAVQSISRQVAAKKVTMLRNQLLQSSAAHNALAEAKPAYSLDEEDE